MVKTLAVWYKLDEFGGGFLFLSGMERSAVRKSEPGLVESARKGRL